MHAVDARHVQLVADERDGNGEGHGVRPQVVEWHAPEASMAILSPSSVVTGRSTRVALTMSRPVEVGGDVVGSVQHGRLSWTAPADRRGW